MNYLAHFHLAATIAPQSPYSQRALLVGGLLGDFIKGPLKGEWPDDWEAGIRLHRRIDALTDHHPLSRQCLDLLPREYRRYGGIMLDLCFDHCLSQHWSRYHAEPLLEFNRRAYNKVLAEQHRYPKAAARQISILAQYDVLSGMGDWQRIVAMLERIGQRLKRENPLAKCGDVLAAHLPEIDQRFHCLYPELLQQLQNEFSTPAPS